MKVQQHNENKVGIFITANAQKFSGCNS